VGGGREKTRPSSSSAGTSKNRESGPSCTCPTRVSPLQFTALASPSLSSHSARCGRRNAATLPISSAVRDVTLFTNSYHIPAPHTCIHRKKGKKKNSKPGQNSKVRAARRDTRHNHGNSRQVSSIVGDGVGSASALGWEREAHTHPPTAWAHGPLA